MKLPFSNSVRASAIASLVLFGLAFASHLFGFGHEVMFSLLGYVAVGFCIGCYWCQRDLLAHSMIVRIGGDDGKTQDD